MSNLGKSFPLNEDKLKSEIEGGGGSLLIDCSSLPPEFNVEINLTDLGIITLEEYKEMFDSGKDIKIRVSNGTNTKDISTERAADGRYTLTALTEISMSSSGIIIVGVIIVVDEGAVWARTSIGLAPNPYNNQ